MKKVQRESTEVLDRRKVDANVLISTDSLVSKYEVLMRENEAKPMTEERSVLLFQVLDNLVPHLGVFKPIFSRVRDELYEYVFSTEHHTTRASRMTNLSDSRTPTASSSHKVDRVPHYLLLKKLLQSRDNNANDLQSQIDTLQESLFKKQVDFEEAVTTIAERNRENQQLTDKVVELERAVQAQQMEIERLAQTMADEKLSHTELVEELERQCDQLQCECDEKESEIQYLSVFKHGYDDMDESFLQYAAASPDLNPPQLRSNDPDSAVATKREHLINDIQASKKLEEQVLTVMNTIIEQYDEFVEAQKVDLSRKNLLDNSDAIELRRLEREIDQSDQELCIIQERFKASMEDINQELGLLRQHYSMLEEQLHTIDEERKKKAKPTKKKAKMMDKAPDEPIQPEEIRNISLDPADYRSEEYDEDPFEPHERIFSKYSVMLYYSQDAGKNYYIHQDCRYCESCHEKTIACPHKVLGESKVILMPHKVTHIKLKRPTVKISKILDDIKHPPSTAGTLVNAGRRTGISAKSDRLTTAADSTRLSPTAALSVTSSVKMQQMKNPLELVWDDFHIRTEMRRPIARLLSLERTMSIFEQFMAYTAWLDQFASEEDGYGSVLDNLYQFFGDRYIKEEAQYAAAYDFLSAVIRFAPEHKQLQLFAHSLVGNIDFAASRYILVLSNYIENIDWQDVEDFRSFATCVYPFIRDEDLESIQMGYVSFSENRISKLHVFEYILYLTLKGREPRIQDLEHQMMQYPSREIGQMNDDEFSEAADHVLQVPDEKMRKALFSETLLLLQNTEPDVFHVHVSKLACILAYLQLVEQSSNLNATIHQFIAENRPKHEESLGVHGHVVAVNSNIHLLTMASVENLSFNIAKRNRCRHDRASFEADFM